MKRQTSDSRACHPGQYGPHQLSRHHGQRQRTTLTFDYEGALANADDSPVEGLKLPISGTSNVSSISGRWFPVTNYGIDRFTATINVTAPAGITVVVWRLWRG